MKIALGFLLVALFISCAHSKGMSPDVSSPSAPSGITQVSVIDTNFDGSVLYEDFIRRRTEGPLIPGMMQALVPQGMAYWENENLMIISNYMSDESAGVLSFVNMENGQLEKSIFLFEQDGNPHKGHLGGLAISRSHLWLASGQGVYYLSLDDLKHIEDLERVMLPQLIVTETKGSFATYSDNILWVGEFTLNNGRYPVSETHEFQSRDGGTHRAWLGGYILNDETDLVDERNTNSGKIVPDYILSIADKVQGALFYGDKIILSESYGRKNYSRLHEFNNPMKEESHIAYGLNPEEDIPFWFLDDINRAGEMIIPPMSEAIVLFENKVAVLFESSAMKYRDTALYPLDKIQFIPVEIFDEKTGAE